RKDGASVTVITKMGPGKINRRRSSANRNFVPSVTKGAPDPHGSRKSMDAMSNRTKQRRSGGLNLLLYQKTLHPELFRILASERVVRRAYEADIWLVEGGHVIMFTAGKHTLTEVIVTNNEPLTDRGLMQSIPCRGEKYHEMTANGIRY